MTDEELTVATQELSDAYQDNKNAQNAVKDYQASLDDAYKAVRVSADRLIKAKSALDDLIMKASDDPKDTYLKH